GGATTGTARLVRVAARRDRVVLPVWIVTVTGLAAAVVSTFESTVADEAARVATAQFSASNPLTRVFDGPAAGTELGAMIMVEAYLILAVLTAIMSLQAVTRHTRLEEETGRAELVGSTAVGREARLLAALLLTMGAALVVGAAITTVLTAGGHGGAGAVAAGASITATGWVFAAVAAVTAQVMSTARAANATAGAVLAGAFVLRAVGDLMGTVEASGVEVTSAWPSWLSPLGWGQQVRPYADDRWWVLALPVLTALALVAVAAVLQARRDVGLGM
ncbi:anibiotic ABC transporter, partial [Cellulomonas bogoriensis 69B4 = DSM 16987]